jgi:hypothetical protein
MPIGAVLETIDFRRRGRFAARFAQTEWIDHGGIGYRSWS